MCGVIQCWIS